MANRLIPAVFVLIMAGCGDPITWVGPAEYENIAIRLEPSGLTGNEMWPLDNNGYRIPQPKLMAYLDSVTRPIESVRFSEGDLASWPPNLFPPSVDDYLRNGFGQVADRLDVVATLETDRLAGPQAFDVSADGRRMVAVIDGQLSLYDLTTGDPIGSRAIPGDSGQDPRDVRLVRFVPDSSDLLLGSMGRLTRISGSDGSVVASVTHDGDTIVELSFDHTASRWIAISQDGLLLTGPTSLSQASRLHGDGEISVTMACFSHDDKHLLFGRRDQEEEMLLWAEMEAEKLGDMTRFRFDENFQSIAAVASTGSSELFTNRRKVCFQVPEREKRLQFEYLSMFWEPSWMSGCHDEDGRGWYLVLGQRLREGVDDATEPSATAGPGTERTETELTETVLYSLDPVTRDFSHPLVLDHRPHRIAHNDDGSRLALLDEAGLHLAHRDAFANAVPKHEELVDGLIDADQLSVVDQLGCLSSTYPRCFGRSPGFRDSQFSLPPRRHRISR